MAICYWQLCHCPDATPCAEHDGFDCSLFKGATISDEAQANDPITAALNAALVMMTDDETKIEAAKTKLKARKTDLEREKREIERDANAATNRSQRQGASDRADKANQAIKKLADELTAITDELDAMIARWQTATSTASSKLIKPYADASGYCACYDRKKQRLAVIAAQISSEQAVYGNLLSQYSAIRATVLTAVTDVKIWTGSLLTGAILYAWIYFAFSQVAAIAILVALIIIALALLALIIHVLVLQSQMAASLRRLTALILMYYRLQNISTCQKDDSTGDDDSEWFEWFQGWLEKPTQPAH